MNNDSVRNNVISSLFWKLMERAGAQVITFIISIILARLLTPNDYGLVAIINVFVVFANVFIQSGFNTALIQKKHTNNTDFSTVLFFSLFTSVLLYIVLFKAAPSIANFYKQPILTILIRVLGTTLISGAFNSVQIAYISRNMLFKKSFVCYLISISISGIVGLILAYSGYGVWAIVFQQLVNQYLIVFLLFFVLDWKPIFSFSLKNLLSMLDFAWKILATNVLSTFFMNFRSLIIGKLFSPSNLGFYSRGVQFPALIVNNINGSIQSVMFPTFSSNQDNKDVVKKMLRRSIITSSFIIFPLMIGLAAVSKSLVLLLLTDKWMKSVPFLQIYCAIYAIMPIHTSNIEAIKGLGYSNIILRLEMIKKIIDLIILMISIPIGIYAIAIGELLSGLVSTFINAYPNKKLLNYSFREQISDIAPYLFISIVMGILVKAIEFLNFNNMLTLILQVIVGIAIYLVICLSLKMEAVIYVKNTMKSFSNIKM